jgi:hypothetical protein
MTLKRDDPDLVLENHRMLEGWVDHELVSVDFARLQKAVMPVKSSGEAPLFVEFNHYNLFASQNGTQNF